MNNLRYLRKQVAILSALFLICAPIVAQESIIENASTPENELIEWVLATLDSTMKENNIPAISIGIVRNEEELLNAGIGLKERGRSEKVDERAIYQIGSLSKMFTGIIASHLISEGKLDIKESILTYLPSTLSSEAKEKLRPITLKDLLQHRSGFRRDAPTNRRKSRNEPLLIEYTTKDMVHDLNKLKLKFEPNTDFSYSNFGYAVIGYICEQVSGLDYPTLLRQYVAEKYGLSNTFIYPNAEQLKLIPTPYKPNNREKKTQPWRMGKLSPAGGIYSNTGDLLKLMIAQIRSYQRFLENDLRDPLVLTNKTDPIGLHYGFGLYKNVKDDLTFYFHGGDLDGFSSVYIFSPKPNLGLIILTTSGGAWIHYVLTDKIVDKLKTAIP